MRTEPLTSDAIFQLMKLVRGADTVELKLTVAEDQRYATLQALEVDPLEVQIREIYFFDTPDLALDAAGVVVRARRIQDAAADTVIKLRPVVPGELSQELRADPAFGVEVDVMPGGFVASASMKGVSSNEAVRSAARGDGKVKKLFTKAQRALYATHAPEGLAIEDLVILGPIPIFKLKMRPAALGRKLVLELWNFPDGSRILELSTKSTPNQMLDVVTDVRTFLTDHGVDLYAQQSTKTRTALNFFSSSGSSSS
jgi:hypothetical protein